MWTTRTPARAWLEWPMSATGSGSFGAKWPMMRPAENTASQTTTAGKMPRGRRGPNQINIG
eukprot:9335812-Lingulodinium_polyedra.AAC.1